MGEDGKDTDSRLYRGEEVSSMMPYVVDNLRRFFSKTNLSSVITICVYGGYYVDLHGIQSIPVLIAYSFGLYPVARADKLF